MGDVQLEKEQRGDGRCSNNSTFIRIGIEKLTLNVNMGNLK